VTAWLGSFLSDTVSNS